MPIDEEQLLKRVQDACREARQQTLDSGSSVIESSDGWLVETFPDGTQTKIKKLPPRQNVEKGTIIKIKKKGTE